MALETLPMLRGFSFPRTPLSTTLPRAPPKSAVSAKDFGAMEWISITLFVVAFVQAIDSKMDSKSDLIWAKLSAEIDSKMDSKIDPIWAKLSAEIDSKMDSKIDPIWAKLLGAPQPWG
jgi:hypothetical protein